MAAGHVRYWGVTIIELSAIKKGRIKDSSQSHVLSCGSYVLVRPLSDAWPLEGPRHEETAHTPLLTHSGHARHQPHRKRVHSRVFYMIIVMQEAKGRKFAYTPGQRSPTPYIIFVFLIIRLVEYS